MIAGRATPSDARMMWKPSVNAIWLRAASRFEAASGRAPVSIAAPPRGTASPSLADADRRWRRRVLGPVDPGRVRAVQHLRSAVLGEVVRGPLDERVDARAHAGHQRGMDAQPGRERYRAVQL